MPDLPWNNRYIFAWPQNMLRHVSLRKWSSTTRCWHFCHVFSIVHGHFEASCCYGEGFQRERLELQESAEDGGQLGVYPVASFRAAASLPEGSMNWVLAESEPHLNRRSRETTVWLGKEKMMTQSRIIYVCHITTHTHIYIYYITIEFQ